MWGSRTNWPSYHGNVLVYKLYIIYHTENGHQIYLKQSTQPPKIIEKTIPAYRVQRKKIIGPQDRCALPHCKLQAKILQPPAKQLDSCNHNIQIWGWIQLIQRRCGENQDQHFLGVYVCSKTMKSSKHIWVICKSPSWKTSSWKIPPEETIFLEVSEVIRSTSWIHRTTKKWLSNTGHVGPQNLWTQKDRWFMTYHPHHPKAKLIILIHVDS